MLARITPELKCACESGILRLTSRVVASARGNELRVVRTKAKTDINGVAHISVPTAMPGQSVELVLVINKVKERRSPRPAKRFADLVGRLVWSGDALSEQRRLRDEW